MVKQNNAVETNFVRDFFLRNTQTLTDTFKENEDNPAQMSVIGDAIIEGSTIDLPEKDVQEIQKPLVEIKEAYTDEALKNFNAKQTEAAKQSNEVSLTQAYDSAIQSLEDKEPLSIQSIKTSAFIQIARENAELGIISQKFANDQIEQLGKANIANNLSAALLDTKASEKQKLQFLQMFVTGKTGDQTIDTLMEPSDRIQMVMQVLNSTRQLKAYEDDIKKEQKDAEINLFQEKLTAYRRDVALGNFKSPKEQLERRNELYQLADPKDYDDIMNADKGIVPTTTSALATKIISDAKADGSWNEAMFNNLVSQNLLSAETIKQESEKLRDIYNQNKNLGEEVISKARSVLRYTETTPFAFNDFMSKFAAKTSDRIMTRSEVVAAGEEALQETLKSGQNTKLIQESFSNEFVQKAGINYRDALKQHSTALFTVTQRMKKEGKEPTFEDVKPELRRQLKLFMEQKKKAGTQATVYDSNGNPYSDELLLDIQMSEIAKATEMQYE